MSWRKGMMIQRQPTLRLRSSSAHKSRLQKIILVVGASFLLFQSAAVSGGSLYKDVFDTDIYDQSELERGFTAVAHHPESLQNKKLNEEILRLFYLKKFNALEKNVFKALDRELEDIIRYQQEQEPSIPRKVLKTAGTFLGSLSNPTASGVLPVGAIARVLFVAPAAGRMIGGAATGIDDFLTSEGKLNLEKLTVAIGMKKKELVDGLHKEPVADIERAHVLSRRFRSPALIKKMDTTLINMRRDGEESLNFSLSFLENCLRLPLQKKVIDPTFPWLYLDKEVDSSKLTPTQEFARNMLKLYPPCTKEKLQRISIKTACASRPNVVSSGRFFVFYGEPGLGKTNAARALPMLWGVPYYEMAVRTSEDISQRSLEGADWQKEAGNPGHIAQALFESIKDGKDCNEELRVPLSFAADYSLEGEIKVQIRTQKARNNYKNAVLIINDFDRLLLDPNTSTSALAFLLDFLDPEKKSVFSRYFQAFIETDGLIVFITATTQIPNEERFKALKDRCTEIPFSAFESEAKNQILSDFIRVQCPTFSLVNAEELRDELLALKEIKETTSLRKAKIILEEEMTKKMMLNPPQYTEGEENAFSPENSEIFTSNDLSLFLKSSSEIFSLIPPTMSNKQVGTYAGKLDTLSKAAERLGNAQDNTKQREAMQELLGTSGRAWHNYGTLNALWKTKTSTLWYYTEGSDNLGALANRLKRFNTREARNEVIRVHSKVVQSITEALLKLKPGDFSIYKEIINDPVRIQNIQIFAKHLELLGKLANQDTCENEKLTEEDKTFLKEFNSWLGDITSDKSKYKLLLTKYQLVTDNSSSLQNNVTINETKRSSVQGSLGASGGASTTSTESTSSTLSTDQ